MKKRNPFAAAIAAVRSLFSKPKKRTVEMPTPALPGESGTVTRLRPRFKHGKTSLHWRRHWRPARRAALSLRWSRGVMAEGRHPVASMWRAFCEKHGTPVGRKMGGPGWKSFKKAQRRAVSR